MLFASPICTSNNPLFWAKIGFITYSFLPATGLIFCLQYLKSKWKGYHILIIPTIYSLIILFRDDLITNTVCHTYFVSTFNQFFASLRESFLGLIYLTYYFGLIILIIYLLIKNHYKEQNKIRKKINILMISAIILSLLPAIVLLFIFPTLRMSFPSIYCHFATLFTFAALRVYHLESKIKR